VTAGTSGRAGAAWRLAGLLAALRRSRLLANIWALTRGTVSVCLRYRVTGLASEAGFFALLSLPPLILGLVAGVGYVGDAVGADTVGEVQEQIRRYAREIFASDTIVNTVTTSIDDVLNRGRLDLLSLAFALSLWSGSRVLNVFLDTISIMYGQGGERGIVRTRVLSFSLYTVALVVGALVLPLVLLGPSLLAEILPVQVQFLLSLYWPVLSLVTLASLASLYHVSTPRRSAWFRDLPGAGLALVIWVAASFVLRLLIAVSVGGTSIYGPLAASIVVLIWLYFLAIAVLIGAALNAASRELWPPSCPPAEPAGEHPAHHRPLTPVGEPGEELVDGAAEPVAAGPAVGESAVGESAAAEPAPADSSVEPSPGEPVDVRENQVTGRTSRA
jgi:membrane protein